MNPRMQEVAEGVAKIITQFFNLPYNAAKGISWLTVKDWQTKSHTFLNDLKSMSQTQRDNTVKEILDIYKQRLMRILNDPEEQKQFVDEAMEKVWNIYKIYEKQQRK